MDIKLMCTISSLESVIPLKSINVLRYKGLRTIALRDSVFPWFCSLWHQHVESKRHISKTILNKIVEH